MRALTFACTLPIVIYRWLVSPFLPPSCRYHPSCSSYALEAIRRFGPAVGGILAARRLLRCHPWGGWGYDPVPLTTPLATLRERQARE